MPLFIKSSSSGDWPSVKKFFVKSSTSGNWPTVKKAFVKSVAGWVQFWPKSGPFTTLAPYFATNSTSPTRINSPIIFGTTVRAYKGNWDGNGGTIASYSYRLDGSDSATIGEGNIENLIATGSITDYITIPFNLNLYDGKWLIFTVTATTTAGVSASDSTDNTETGTGYRIPVIRNNPVKKSGTDAIITSSSTALPATLIFTSQWDGSAPYLPDTTRSSVKWYRASSGSYTADNIATYGTEVTTGITTDVPVNSGGTYTVTSTLVTPSSLPSSTYYYAVDTQKNSGTDYNFGTNIGVTQFDVYGPMAYPPAPIGQSPSITGSTTVGNLAYFNIGSWTNSPTSYAWRIYYNYNLVSGVLTYAGIKSVTHKTLTGFSAALRTSSNHNYKVNDKLIITGMDNLFNKASPGYTISYVNGDVVGFTIDAPTAYYVTDAYVSGAFVSYNGNAYRAVSSLSAGTNFSITPAYSVGANVAFGGLRYICISALNASTAWLSTSSYSVGQNVYYNSNRYIAISSIPANSSAPGVNSSWVSVMPNNTSYWVSAEPTNSTYWTLQSFTAQAASGTATAPNYYEGTTTTEDSFPLTVPITDYKSGYDLRGQQLGIGARAYNEAALTPQEYTAEKTVYGYPVLTINSVTPSNTTASIAQTASYVSSYTIDVKHYATITSVTGGASTVTYFGANSFVAGQTVTITGINPSQYNITGTVASATSSSFTINTNITGAYVSGGSVTASAPTYPKTVSYSSGPISITNLKELTYYDVSISPRNGEPVTGVTQTTSFTTYATPTISTVSLVNTKAPSSATSPSFSSSSSNIGTLSWTNGANSSTAWLRSVSGAGTLATVSDPGTLNTSGTFTITSTGTANATVRSINKGKSVYVTWNQTNASSYVITYRNGTSNLDVITGNSSASNPEILIYGPISGVPAQIEVTNVTVYHLANQTGPSASLSLSPSLTLTPSDSNPTDTSFSGTVTYTILPAYNPTIGTLTSTADGFTGQVTNYSGSFNYSISSSAGTASFTGSPSIPNATYNFTVTGLNPGQSADITITTTRTGYQNGSLTATGTATAGAALTPTFETNVPTTTGFTGKVTNYNSNYTWNITVNGGASVAWGTVNGSNYPFTVTGGTAPTSYTVTVTTSRTGYTGGSATTSATVLYGGLTPTFGTNIKRDLGFEGSVNNYDSAYTWTVSVPSPQSVTWGTASGTTRPFTVTGGTSGSSYTVTVGTSRSGYESKTATVSGEAGAKPSGGTISISLLSGTSGRVGAVFSSTKTDATGNPASPTISYQWYRNINYSPNTTSAISSATSSSYTTTYDDVDSGIYCIATWTNTAGTQTATSNSLLLSPPTITAIRATTTNNTGTYCSWEIIGYNIQSSQGTVFYGATTPPTILSGQNPQTNSGLTRATTSRSGTTANYYRYDNVRAFSGLNQGGRPSPSVSAIATTTVVRANAATTTTVYGTFP